MTALGTGQAALLVPGSSPRSPLPGSPETHAALSTRLPHGGARGGLCFSDPPPHPPSQPPTPCRRPRGSQRSISPLAVSKMVVRELIFGEAAWSGQVAR